MTEPLRILVGPHRHADSWCREHLQMSLREAEYRRAALHVASVLDVVRRVRGLRGPVKVVTLYGTMVDPAYYGDALEEAIAAAKAINRITATQEAR